MPYPRFPRSREGEEKRPTPWRLVLITLLSTVLFFGIYAYFVMREGHNWLFWVYLGVLLGFAVWYIVCNRAFSDASLTYYSLPPTWSDAEKKQFLFERDERKRRSKWMLVIIFPLAITLMFDMIYLFFGDTLLRIAENVGRGLGIW